MKRYSSSHNEKFSLCDPKYAPMSSLDRVRQNSMEYFEKTGKWGYPSPDELRRAQIERAVSKDPFLKNMTKLESATAGVSAIREQGLSGLKHGASDLLVHGIDKAVPGLGHHYLMPKLAAIDLSIGVYNRTNNAIAEGKPSGQAFTCGVVGASAQTGTSLAGNIFVTGAATALTVESGGALLAPATIGAAAGYAAVGVLSHQVGNTAEKACHATFDVGRKVDEKLKQIDFKSLFKKSDNSTSTLPTFSFSNR